MLETRFSGRGNTFYLDNWWIWGDGIRQTFRYTNIQGFVCFLPAVSVELIKGITSPTNFKGCMPESQSAFFLYLSVTVTPNLTSYSLDLHFPSRPLKDHDETSSFPFSRQGNIPRAVMWLAARATIRCESQACPLCCNMLLQPGLGDWNCFSAPCHGCGVVPRVCMFWPSLGTAAVHHKAERGLHYCPQYPESSSFPFSCIHHKYALIL